MWQPFPKFYIVRPDGKHVPLIPLDELPSWLQVGFMDWNHPNLYMFMIPATISVVPREGEYDVICQYCISSVDNTLHRSASESGQDAVTPSPIQRQKVPNDIDIAAIIPQQTTNDYKLPDVSYLFENGKVSPKSFPILQQPPFYSSLQRPIVGMCFVRCARFLYGHVPTIFSQRELSNHVPPPGDDQQGGEQEDYSRANGEATGPRRRSADPAGADQGASGAESVGGEQGSSNAEAEDEVPESFSDTPLLAQAAQPGKTSQNNSGPQPGSVSQLTRSAPASLGTKNQKPVEMPPPTGGADDSSYDASVESSSSDVDLNADARSKPSGLSDDSFFQKIPESLDEEVPAHLVGKVKALMLKAFNEGMRTMKIGQTESSDSQQEHDGLQDNDHGSSSSNKPDSATSEMTSEQLQLQDSQSPSTRIDEDLHDPDESAKPRDSDEEEQDPRGPNDSNDPKDPKDPPEPPDAQESHGSGDAHEPNDPPTQQNPEESQGQSPRRDSEASQGASDPYADDGGSVLLDASNRSKGLSGRGQVVYPPESSKAPQAHDRGQSVSDTHTKRAFVLPDRTRQVSGTSATKRTASTASTVQEASTYGQAKGNRSLSQAANDSRLTKPSIVREALRLSRQNQPAKSVRFDLPQENDEPKVDRQQRGRPVIVRRNGSDRTAIKCKALHL
ncbi:hypothetical protein BDV12DRAFT_194991 [Aspergillus spectabilis]